MVTAKISSAGANRDAGEVTEEGTNGIPPPRFPTLQKVEFHCQLMSSFMPSSVNMVLVASVRAWQRYC